jgi:hypothetical protein
MTGSHTCKWWRPCREEDSRHLAGRLGTIRRIRKAWAAPPPGIEDDVVDDVVRRISRTAMARRKRGIIAGLAEAERLGDHEKVAALEVEWRELSGRT